jgi:hypothetical protein
MRDTILRVLHPVLPVVDQVVRPELFPADGSFQGCSIPAIHGGLGHFFAFQPSHIVTSTVTRSRATTDAAAWFFRGGSATIADV